MSFVEFELRPDVRDPSLVCAFRGWNDAGEAASMAVRYLVEHWGAARFARLDPEEFFDFQVTRPTVRVVDGTSRRIEWPANDFYLARPGPDVVLFLGVEPNVRWRTFAGTIVDVARDLGARLLVTLGAFLGDVPHTLPAPVTASSTDPRLVQGLGTSPARYEGPTGIVGVLHDSCRRVGLPSVSLWGAAPAYLPASANPKVAVALLTRLGALLGVPVDAGALAEGVADWERRVQEAVDEDPNLAAYVRRLEQAATAEDELQPGSGEALAAELERFLREQGDAGGSTGRR